jgi:hypothetical protein
MRSDRNAYMGWGRNWPGPLPSNIRTLLVYSTTTRLSVEYEDHSIFSFWI